jgi:hypothetical protein
VKYRDVVIGDLRLVMLRLLGEAGGQTLNLYLLAQQLPTQGHPGHSMDRIRSELTWLEEQALVSLVSDPPLMVATLTERGYDVAQGRATVPGVEKPHPGR